MRGILLSIIFQFFVFNFERMLYVASVTLVTNVLNFCTKFEGLVASNLVENVLTFACHLCFVFLFCIMYSVITETEIYLQCMISHWVLIIANNTCIYIFSFLPITICHG